MKDGKKKEKAGLSKNQKAGLVELGKNSEEIETDEARQQMGLCDGPDRELLTDDELSSRFNISHNSDNGYLYQDADFLCGAIIKLRKEVAKLKK